jgi:hypothetical protein
MPTADRSGARQDDNGSDGSHHPEPAVGNAGRDPVASLAVPVLAALTV